MHPYVCIHPYIGETGYTMINIILCIALVVVPFTIVLVVSYRDAQYTQVADRLVTLNPIPHDGSVEYVYTRSYMEALAPVVEFDINGYFDNKESN